MKNIGLDRRGGTFDREGYLIKESGKNGFILIKEEELGEKLGATTVWDRLKKTDEINTSNLKLRRN